MKIMRYTDCAMTLVIAFCFFGCSSNPSVQRSQYDTKISEAVSLYNEGRDISGLPRTQNCLNAVNKVQEAELLRGSKEIQNPISNEIIKLCERDSYQSAGSYKTLLRKGPGKGFDSNDDAFFVCMNTNDFFRIAFYCEPFYQALHKETKQPKASGNSVVDLFRSAEDNMQDTLLHYPRAKEASNKYQKFKEDASEELRYVLAILQSDYKFIESYLAKGGNPNHLVQWSGDKNPYLTRVARGKTMPWRSQERLRYSVIYGKKPVVISPLWLSESRKIQMLLLKYGADLSHELPYFKHNPLYYKITQKFCCDADGNRKAIEKWHAEMGKNAKIVFSDLLNDALYDPRLSHKTLKHFRSFMLKKGYLNEANLGNSQAQFDLGKAYASGNGVKKDALNSANWFRKAAEQGHIEAQYFLGVAYSTGLGITKDKNKAIKWYRKAAEQGHAEAQYGLAGVVDETEVIKWYRKAAKQRHARAQFVLAGMYEQGLFVPKDKKPAAEWYRMSAEQGHMRAQYHLGVMYNQGQGLRKNAQQAAFWFQKAAEQGDVEAQNKLGSMYEIGLGVPKDQYKSIELYRKAAEQGDPEGQLNLGVKYQIGEGVLKDFKQAVAWYRKSAKQGYAQGQVFLGRMYNDGKGVQKAPKEAVKWYRKASDQGNPDGEFLLGHMYYNGFGVNKDIKQAVALYQDAAEQGHQAAQSILGMMYIFGKDLPRNMKKAKFWTQQAIDSGQVSAESTWEKYQLWKY